MVQLYYNYPFFLKVMSSVEKMIRNYKPMINVVLYPITYVYDLSNTCN